MLKSLIFSTSSQKVREDAKVSVYTVDEGDYKIEIEHNNYIDYESEIIKVIAGETTDALTIELLVPVFSFKS